MLFFNKTIETAQLAVGDFGNNTQISESHVTVGLDDAGADEEVDTMVGFEDVAVVDPCGLYCPDIIGDVIIGDVGIPAVARGG